MLAGQVADDRETEPGAGERGQVRRVPGDGLLRPPERRVAHGQAAVLDGDQQSGRHLADVGEHLGAGRTEVAGVVEEFGQDVHHALGRVPGHRDARRHGAQPHPPVAGYPAHRAPQHRLHGDRARPAAAGAGAAEHRDGVGQAAGLRGAVVDVQQVGQDVAVVVALLHLPQFGEGGGGDGLHAPGRVRAGGQGGGPARLAAAQRADHVLERPGVLGPDGSHGGLPAGRRELGQHPLRGGAPGGPGDRRRERGVGEPDGVRLEFGVPLDGAQLAGAEPGGESGGEGQQDATAGHGPHERVRAVLREREGRRAGERPARQRTDERDRADSGQRHRCTPQQAVAQRQGGNSGTL